MTSPVSNEPVSTSPVSTDQPSAPAVATVVGTGETAAATSAPAGIEEDAVTALRRALSIEHAAIWAYGLISAYAPDDAAVIETNRNGHIYRRDAAIDRVLAAGGKNVQPQAAYHSPIDVTDEKSARRLARISEDDCCNGWYAVLAATDNQDLRTFALSGLSDSAVRLALLRQEAKEAPFTTPLPGQD